MRRLWLVLAALSVALWPGAEAVAARLALVIGNDSYVHAPALRNARNDARTVAKELEAAGFAVTRLLDGTRRDIHQALDAFLRRVGKGDEVVFYFSGHGSQPPQSGPFLLPVDIEISSERSIIRDGLSLEQVVDDLGQRARFSLVIVDACRDDPFRQTSAGRSLAPGSSLSRIEPPKGTMIIMAASKGQQALDRLSDDDPVPNGLFTRELVKLMRQPGLSASDMLRSVRANVERAAQAVRHTQRPALVDESSSDFFFYPGKAVAAVAPAAPAERVSGAAMLAPGYAPQREFDVWEQAMLGGTQAGYESYLRRYPEGRYAAQARARIAQLGGARPPTAPDPLQRPSGR